MTAAPTAAKAEGLLSQVPASAPSGEPAWLTERREAAIQHLRTDGFPRKKHEAWRFTSVREVVGTAFRQEEPGATDPSEAFGEVQEGSWRLLCAAGRAQPAAGDPPAGVRVHSLAAFLRESPERLAEVLAQLVPNRGFAALNAARFDDGLVLEIAPGAAVEPTIEVAHVSPKPGFASYPRTVVLAGAGSTARLVEKYVPSRDPHAADGGALHCPVTEVLLSPGARLDHVRATFGQETESQLGHLGVRLEKDAHYRSHVFTLGGRLSRVELNVAFAGPGAEAILDGVYHVAHTEHVDHQLFVDHAVSHCASHVTYRGLLDGRGHAVFNAIGAVRPGTVGSAAHQENRNLLLSDDAVVDTKPHLEIEADDVTASHGTAIGALDSDQLYYLRSRGLPEAQARATLTFAFVQALLERVPDRNVGRLLSENVLRVLPDGASIRELLA